MWQQNYHPHNMPTAAAALLAAAPILLLLLLLGVARKPAWFASLIGLAAALAVAIAWYRMPVPLALSAAAFGSAFGLFPITWIVFWAIVLYRVTVESGRFEILKDYLGSLTPDPRMQALLVAFAFGAFLEGAAGFGAPVAISAAMLAGLGFSPFSAASICLLANTAPVAFGSIGIPIITLHATTGLPLAALSSQIGRFCAPVSLLVPAYLVIVLSGWRGLKGVLPAAATCGVAFAGAQLLVSNLLGPYLTDIIASLSALLALLTLLRFWRPADGATSAITLRRYTARQVASAWMPYGFLVVFVLLWGWRGVKRLLDLATVSVPWPALDGLILRTAPDGRHTSYPALYSLNLLSTAGTACMCAALAACLLLRMPARTVAKTLATAIRQLATPTLTIAAVLAMAFVMNYSGATTTLGLAFAASGSLFPFFSPLLGWLGVFLTGSDTAANALFGNLQVVTANTLHFKPTLMAAANSTGGVVGKMISLQSIAVAAAATGMKATEESKLFRFTLRHSLLLVCLVGLISLFYTYVAPGWTN